MKKLIITALVAVLVTGSAFATDASKVNIRIRTNFSADFTQAENVTWIVKPNFAKATFFQDGEKKEAFYDFGGDLIGTSVQVAINKIPATAKKFLGKKYADYTITEAIYFSNKDEDAYFISAENSEDKIIFKVKESSNISIFQKERKK